VPTTLDVTTLPLSMVARARWGRSLAEAIPVTGFVLAIDLAFWGANLLKIPSGGWVPLAVGAVIFTMITSWKKGRQILTERLHARSLPRQLFVNDMLQNAPPRVRGTAVFMDSNIHGTPPALLHNLKHNQVLHEKVVLLSVLTEEVPYVLESERVKLNKLGEGIYQIILHVGFMESIDVPEILATIREEGLSFKPMTTSYFLSRETIIPSEVPGMAIWRERLFGVMARNARPASSFFNLPPNRVVEMGAQIEL
jgi:KUP system potassium uptake protein